MATTNHSKSRPARSLITLFVLIIALFATIFAGMQWSTATSTPKLALDLEGGTQIILQPVTENGEKVTGEDINQAISIIRQRIDSSGVSEAEISRQGSNNIVVALPGKPSEETLDKVRKPSQMRFRPVLYFAGPDVITPTATTGDATTGDATTGDATTGDATTGDATTGDATTGDATTDGTATDGTKNNGLGASTDGTVKPASFVSKKKVATDTTAADATPPADATTPPADATPPADSTTPPADAAPTNASSLSQITEDLMNQFNALDCTDPANLGGGGGDDPAKPLVACEQDGSAKYILGPVEVEGTEIASANSGLKTNAQGQATNEWVVNIEFNSTGAKQFAEVTARLKTQAPSTTWDPTTATEGPNMFAIVLDGVVRSAPGVEVLISDGRAEISGNFTRTSAKALADNLNFGALPLSFTVQSEQQISATLGSEQLQKGIFAGLIGLLLVVLYSLLQYRALGLVTVASLIIAALGTYGTITLLSWLNGYRLSLAGVAGLIVAIGITADSFIVYFERIRDELRDGRPLLAAVEVGWSRARRTILASDAVNLCAAVVLYFLAVGGVRGFAFTLGLTTVIDVIVVFLFTHPVMLIIAKWRFFADGHRLSGLDPRKLGVKMAHYAGRGRVVLPKAVTGSAPLVETEANAPLTDGSPVDTQSGRLTIAERRALAAQKQDTAAGAPEAEAEQGSVATDTRTSDDADASTDGDK